MMIIKSNPVTEEVSAVDGHQLYKLITPQGEKRDPNRALGVRL